jgi:hypothetical protein
MRTNIGVIFRSNRVLTQIEPDQQLAQDSGRFGIKIWEDLISRFGKGTLPNHRIFKS